MTGIYTIENKVNGKVYVGHALHIKPRLTAHYNELRRGIHCNSHLQHAVNQYGIDNFKFELLEECEERYLLSQENYWCNMLRTHSRDHGYNIQPTNPELKKPTPSIETRKKISETLTGRKSNFPNAMKGKHHTIETVDKIRKAVVSRMSRPFYSINLKTGEKVLFNTMVEASKIYNCRPSNMFLILNRIGHNKAYKGFTFVYLENFDESIDYRRVKKKGG